MKYTLEEIKAYLEGQLFLGDRLDNRRLEGAIRELDDSEDGIEAVTLRNRTYTTAQGENK